MDYFHKILLVLVSFTIINFNYSQTKISVLDASSGEPIPSVLVFNKNQTESILTDNEGKFDLDIFKANDSIFFSHISYESNSCQLKLPWFWRPVLYQLGLKNYNESDGALNSNYALVSNLSSLHDLMLYFL